MPPHMTRSQTLMKHFSNRTVPVSATGLGSEPRSVPGLYRKDRQVIAPAARAYRRRGHAETTTQASWIASSYSPHSFRATGITNFLENDGTLEAAQRIAGHADSRTTKLYDRHGQKVLLEDMERIRY